MPLNLRAHFDVIIHDNVIKRIDKPNNTCFVLVILMAQYTDGGRGAGASGGGAGGGE